MKRVYTFDGRPAQRNLTLDCFRANKAAGTKMVQVDAGTTAQAALLAECEIDVIATGARETAAVRAGAPTTHITSALTVESFVTPDEARAMAIDCLCAGADSIYTARGLSTVERLAHEGICVQGHLGLVPRLSMRSGGLRAFGKTADEAMQLFADFKRLEDAGAVMAEVECVAAEALALINPLTSLVTFSIGSGGGGDVDFLFLDDICGATPSRPRHAKAWADVHSLEQKMSAERKKGVSGFRDDVMSGRFPSADHTIGMQAGEESKLQEALDKWRPMHQ